MNKRIVCFVLMLVFAFSSISFGDQIYDDSIVVLGENLTGEQKNEMLDYFGVDENIKIIKVTNEEEREYLGKYIGEKLIGTKALSSVYVEKLEEGAGITVESNNITWVTNDMYRNALITAGIKDARIKVSSPIKVSGTAALTGVIKAFEDITGKEIPKKEKEIASEEIAKTATLGNEIGQKEAEELITNVKMYIIKNKVKNKDSIKKIIIEIAKQSGIELTEEQIDQIVGLMKNISKLNLDLGEIKNQLKDISGKIDKITQQNIEIKSLLEKIIDAITGFFNKVFR